VRIAQSIAVPQENYSKNDDVSQSSKTIYNNLKESAFIQKND
jgi:hypothetical protein